jgi:uncharacterized repeat protein (TIGR01451 family)
MIKNYLSLLALCLFSSLNAQIINIPDANFKAKLLEADITNEIAKDSAGKSIKIDLNNNGNIEQSEASSVIYLNVSGSQILSLTGIQNFNNVIDLRCSQNNISELDISNMPKLNAVNCDANKIVSINHSGTPNLRGLSCIDNLLKNLDLSGFLILTELQCDRNQLESLGTDSMPELFILTCSSNLFDNLDLSGLNPDVFTSFNCSFNNISNLDLTRFTRLKTVYCNENPLTNLKITAFESLENLSYTATKLSNYDVTKFSNLVKLYCDQTETTILDLTGLEKLTELSCTQNNIENLDLKDALNLRYLSCIGNKLTSLDLSKLSKLETLYVGFNDLSNLNFKDLVSLNSVDISHCLVKSVDLSNSPILKEFYIYQNPLLEELNVKNGSIEPNLNFSNNPKLKYICADDDQMVNIQNMLVNEGNTGCNVNSYCTFEPGGESFSIQGTNRIDFNNNGCDVLDIPASFLKFKIEDGVESGNLISNGSGNYNVKIAAGNYKITPVLENPSYFSITPAEIQVDFPTVSSPMVQDFCIKSKGVHNDLEVTMLPILPSRPGFTAKYKVIYKNKGNVAQSGTVSLGFDDSVLDLISSNPSVSTTASNKISWDFTDLKPFEWREIILNLKVNAPTEVPAINIGDNLSYTASITSSVIEEMPIDNTFTYNEIVVGSYDPNDKTCLEGNVIKPELIGEYVHYLIRFENTGTYYAENVVVKDIIDTSKFDVSTLVPTSASHSYTTKISDGNKVEFIFKKIDLPFDDANNDGYIAFKIKTLPTLVVGDSFENEAHIYFDYNFPILTNKETSTFKTLGTQDFEFSSYFYAYPNPSQNFLNITSKDIIEIQSMAIYNLLGQLVLTIPNAQNTSKIDISRFQTGNYILQVKTDKGNSTMKFIKI